MRTTAFAALLLSAVVAGCAQNQSGAVNEGSTRRDSASKTPVESNCALDRTEQVLRDEGTLAEYADGAPYEGLSLGEARQRAEAEDIVVRVIGEDGQCSDKALNAQGNRVNFYVEEGTVVRSVGF